MTKKNAKPTRTEINARALADCLEEIARHEEKIARLRSMAEKIKAGDVNHQHNGNDTVSVFFTDKNAFRMRLVTLADAA